ncbi:MAG: 50S ribosomal protein L13 [Patescibacteria group bacterium]
MKTYLPRKNDLKSKWYVIDAAGKTPGKVAVAAARRLTGKHRVDLTPHLDLGDGVIIINAEKISLTAKKFAGKVYRRHSGYKGHLKETTAGELFAKKPGKILELAITGMLPKNRLRNGRMKRLKIFTGAEHSHDAQKPEAIEV